ncbi:sigma-70 family RNA polymerase sigma factor [Fictibacillus sp. Mic-4]|uniref:sigma-70 family RNA polymerase sigma factor n=1 Tax=Fictibacillus sp. Mic-4 TaxID=3132826 RepID=UPI003CF95581
MQDLINEYKETLHMVRKAQETTNKEDKAILRSMASDLEYALQWMRSGRCPGNKRGIERRAAYQREKSINPLVMQKFFRSTEDVYEWDDHLKEDKISDWDRERIEDALSVLTDREREIYLMKRGHCFSYEEIAAYLCISKGTVQKNIERAEKKISERVKQSLFCLCG